MENRRHRINPHLAFLDIYHRLELKRLREEQEDLEERRDAVREEQEDLEERRDAVIKKHYQEILDTNAEWKLICEKSDAEWKKIEHDPVARSKWREEARAKLEQYKALEARLP
jgi:hypothetical protein